MNTEVEIILIKTDTGIDLIGPYCLDSEGKEEMQTREIGRQGLTIDKIFKDKWIAPYEIKRDGEKVGWTPLSSIQVKN